MEKEVKKRDKALELLRGEYEVLKNKVRKYRSQNKSQLSENSQSNESPTRVTCNHDSETIGKLVSELDEAKSREANLEAEIERLRDAEESRTAGNHNNLPLPSQTLPPPPPALLPSSSFTVTDSAAQREIDLLHAELRSCRAQSLKKGADLALAKAKDAYAAAVGVYSNEMKLTVEVLRQRLAELAEFLQRLVDMESDGDLNFSSVSQSFREALHKSLEESRRYSQSLSHSLLAAQQDNHDVNETQNSMFGAIGEEVLVELPQFVWPEIKVDVFGGEGPESAAVDEEMEGKIREYESLILELKDNVNERINAQAEAEKLKIQLREVKDKMRREQEKDYETLIEDLKENVRERIAAQRDAEQLREDMEAMLEQKEQLESDLANHCREKDLAVLNATELKRHLDQLVQKQSQTKATQYEEDREYKKKIAEYEDLILELQNNVQEGIEAQKKTEKLNLELNKLRDQIRKQQSVSFGECANSNRMKEAALPAAVGSRVQFLDGCDKENHSGREYEVASASVCRLSLDGQGCDCMRRIEELERLLSKAQALLDDANEKIRKEAERKERLRKATKKELVKTKTVLKNTTNTPTIPE